MQRYPTDKRHVTISNAALNIFVEWMQREGWAGPGELTPDRFDADAKEQLREFITAVATRFSGYSLSGELLPPAQAHAATATPAYQRVEPAFSGPPEFPDDF